MMQKIRSKSSNEITCNFLGLHKAVTENDKQNLCEQRQFQGIQQSNLIDLFLIETHKYFYEDMWLESFFYLYKCKYPDDSSPG